MENLSKENYWNDMMERFPSVMKDFCEWIDKYKNGVRWEAMFHHDAIIDTEYRETKFHDIPFEMQYGIIFKYFRDSKGIDTCFAFTMVEDWEIKDVITELFANQFVLDIAKEDPDFNFTEG